MGVNSFIVHSPPRMPVIHIIPFGLMPCFLSDCGFHDRPRGYGDCLSEYTQSER